MRRAPSRGPSTTYVLLSDTPTRTTNPRDPRRGRAIRELAHPHPIQALPRVRRPAARSSAQLHQPIEAGALEEVLKLRAERRERAEHENQPEGAEHQRRDAD